MKRITREQQEHWQGAAEQVTAKLKAFRDGLTADEQTILGLALSRVMNEGAGADESVAGFAVNIEDRNPLSRFALEVGKVILIDFAVSGVRAAGSAIVDTVGGQIPDRLPTTGLGGPMGAGGRRGP